MPIGPDYQLQDSCSLREELSRCGSSIRHCCQRQSRDQCHLRSLPNSRRRNFRHQNLHCPHRGRYLHHEPLCQPHLARNLRFCSGPKNPLCSAKSHRHWDQSDCLRRCRQECSMFLDHPHCQFRFQTRLFLLQNQSPEQLRELPRQFRFPNLSLRRLIRPC